MISDSRTEKSHVQQTKTATPSSPGSAASGDYDARAFSGGSAMVVEVQASVRFRDGRQRSSVVASGVPTARVRQILASVLALDAMEYITPEVLRVNVHRPAAGRYENDYGLAVAVAMASSLVRRPISDHFLFVGDVDLHGRVGNVLAARVDRLNDAINAFEIETPLTIVCAPETAAWVNASSTVTVARAVTLADVTAIAWPGVKLLPRQ